MPTVQQYFERAARKRKPRRTVAYGSLVRSYQAAMARKGPVTRLPKFTTSRPVSYRRRAAMQTGESTISFPAKASTVKSDGYVARDSNDLIAINPLNVARVSTTNQDINTRLTDVIYLSGFKVNVTVLNNLEAVTANQLYFNIALLSTKAGVSTITGTDMFTSGGGTARSYSFDNVNYSSLERHQDPINSDNYVCHWHQRYLLSPNQQACQGPQSGSWPYVVPISAFIPIKRQIRFDDAAANSAEPQFRVVLWCGLVGEGYSDPIVQTANAIKTEHSITAYYREP